MIVIGTGITGVGRTKYLESVREYAIEKGFKMDLKDIGPMMFEKASSLRIKIPDDKILDLDSTTLRFLRAAVFEEIIHNVDMYKTGDRDLIISLHMSFRWNKVLLPAFDYYYLNELGSQLYVTLIDSIANIWRRIYEDPDLSHWRGKLSLKEILIWQDEEIFTAEIVSNILNTPYYLVSTSSIGFRRPDPKLLFHILYDVERQRSMNKPPNMLKAYLSYPMTMVKGNEEFEERKNQLVKKLWDSGVIVFDPSMVEDMILVEKAEESGKKDGSIYIDEFDIELPVKDILDSKQYIIDHTVFRDYRLINQSDIVIVFYPVKELSAGVLSEMIYAYTHMKNVYAVFTQKEVSPFFQSYSNKIFRDEDSLIEFIERLVKEHASS